MINFYEFSADTKSKIYASTIINADEYLQNCEKCGSVYEKKEFKEIDLIIEGKGKFPDILLCGHWPLLILSENTLNLWDEKKFKNYTAYPVRLYRKTENNYEECNEKYYNITINGRCDLDFAKMGIKVKNICKHCGTVSYNKETWEFDKPIIKENSWDGSQIFVANGFTRAPICTIEILECVFNNKLTNFSFSNFEDMFDYMAEDIDLKSIFNK